MLIEGAGVVAHRPTPVPFFIIFNSSNAMKKIFIIHYSLIIAMLFAACNNPEPQPKEPEGTTIEFTESDSIFANPERGLYAQSYYTSGDLNSKANVDVIKYNRNSYAKTTLYLDSYYLTDYMESDIPQEFFDRLEINMKALREGGAKAVLRFSYKSNVDSMPWNATPEWVHKHIDQITPYLQKNADVILCVQCGFIGVWGEWYYTDNGFKRNPSKDSDYEIRWEVLEHLLRAVPEDRQVALRTPGYKRRYLKMRGDSLSSPLTAAEAFQNTNKARICAHNDCFVSSSNDVGTFNGTSDREFWAEDSKYTFMGGETCEKTSYSNGPNALSEMAKFHWSYLNRDYRESVTKMWRQDGTMDTILMRLGYRLALEKVILTANPKIENKFEAYCVLHNSGFAAPMNKRDVELVFVNANNPAEKHVFPQTVDPRFWLPGEEHKFTLSCMLKDFQEGQYKLYLNLPDPYPSIHDNPLFSIRLANDNVWDAATGYNYIATINVNGLPD